MASLTETPAMVVVPTEVPDSPSASVAGNSDLPPNIYKPVRFTHSGIDPVTVGPESYIRDPEVAPATQSSASTVVFPGNNPSAYLTLPQGTYTFCYDWELDGDEDGDSYIDYTHKSTVQMSLGQNSPEKVDFATTVNLSPDANSISNGRCSEGASAALDELTPEDRANQGIFLYSADCADSDGEVYTESETFAFKFTSNGVAFSNPEYNESVFAVKTGKNRYEYTGDGTFIRIIYTIQGFELYSGGNEWYANCSALKGK